MKPYRIAQAVCLVCLPLLACSRQWDGHYSQQQVESVTVETFDGEAASFLTQENSFTAFDRMMDKAGIYNKMDKGQFYTLLAYTDKALAGTALQESYATYCICDVACPPSQLKDGLGIRTWYGKNIWITEKDGKLCIDDRPVSRIIRCSNAYIYCIDEGIIPIRPSLYEQLCSLDDADYSTFKQLVLKYEERYFDPSACTPAGTNEQGNIVYSDSVKGWKTRNTLMDRYTEDGVALWDMRSEGYNSTLFIPSNDVIRSAIDSAMAHVPIWLRRKATAADRTKFEQWIVKACFVDQRLSTEEVTGSRDITCVGGYTKETGETVRLRQAEAAVWRPTVQKLKSEGKMTASNGFIYPVTWMKIPNNVVIYRLKSRFYELWNNMTAEQRDQYFHWDHLTEPMVLNDILSAFTLSETLPTIYYHVLTAIPDKEARRNQLVCGVTFDGVLYNENNPKGERIQPCHLPAGEYYVRMGFKSNIEYSLNISFNDTLLVDDLAMKGQDVNFQLDRGCVSINEYYGTSAMGYPEGYNWHDWEELSSKAQAYDTDGYQIGIVRLKEDGNFTITVSSNDMSRLYDYDADRTKSNMKQLMMYHWCLRPTPDNY